MEEIQNSITSSLVSTTRAVSQLANEDLAFHRSLDRALGTSLDRQNARLLSLTSRLLGSAIVQTETIRAPTLKSIEDVENNWRAVIDVVDSLLERADTALDEFTGAVKRLSPAVGSDAEKTTQRGRSVRDLQTVEIEKPQLKFEHLPTNDETGPFVPLLEGRPHALDLGNNDEAQYPSAHPYQAEIEAYRYPASVYTEAEPIMYRPFDSTSATFVDTLEGVESMLDELKEAKEIAIDLEHHDQRSYIGLVSLMQISTRDRDWIIDTLKPWRRKLACLNEVFADPKILKVLHGAYMDIVWLQRDLGLYLVGLFDTHYASRALGYPGGSLAYLLKRFADVDAQKQYQTADWRVRPLPRELFDYARSDTHYLLYIYDNMRNQLVQKSDFSRPDHEADKLHDVLVRSSEIALQRYEHPVYDAEHGQGAAGWYKLLSRTPALLSKDQFAVFREVHKWRDNVARRQDDSTHYVMPNHQIFSIARSMPTTRAELLAIAKPNTHDLLWSADELVSVVTTARQEGSEGPEMMDVINSIEQMFPREKKLVREVVSHSIASFVPQAASGSGGVGTAADSKASSMQSLRSTNSSFWGPAFESSTHQTHHHLEEVDDVELSVPLPPLTAEIFTEPFTESVSLPPTNASQPTSWISAPVSEETTTPVEADDVFVLKELGKKRKRPNSPPAARAVIGEADGLAGQIDEVAIPDNETERLRAKAERKKRKKDAKRLAQAAAADAADVKANGADNEDEEPFDYASAPSILNPPKQSREEYKASKKRIVDPYSKALNTPKGLPKRQKEQAGKSMTYTS